MTLTFLSFMICAFGVPKKVITKPKVVEILSYIEFEEFLYFCVLHLGLCPILRYFL